MGSAEEIEKIIICDLYSKESRENLQKLAYEYGPLTATLELRVNLIRFIDIENRLAGQIVGDVDSLMEGFRM